jgi:alpha-amylase
MPTIAYEIFVPSFCDSNADGIGDLQGVINKLPYLQDLGVDLIWLSPIFTSPSYHKYDVVDYYGIDATFGNMATFELLIKKAHTKSIKIILDLVLNHTSERHAWFLDAKDSKNSAFRDYYIWKTQSEIQDLNAEQRAETADSQEKNPWHIGKKSDAEKYYGMFWSGMPDLNLGNEMVQNEIFEIAQFWLKKGVDGFRLDAAKHVFPPWEEEKTLPFWKKFKEKCQEVNPEVYIAGEVWTSAENVAPYYSSFNSNFNFQLSDALRDIVWHEKDQNDLIYNLKNSHSLFSLYNSDFTDALILGNHDMERIGTVAKGSLEKLKMVALLQLTLPGLPYIYYGDELGMYGPKPDERIREAFLWNTRFQDPERCQWQKPKYNTDSKVAPLALQYINEQSLFSHYKKLIAIRKSNRALANTQNGIFEKTTYAKEGLISFVREHEGQKVLVFQNVSSQIIECVISEGIEEILYLSGNSTIENNRLNLGFWGSAIFSTH